MNIWFSCPREFHSSWIERFAVGEIETCFEKDGQKIHVVCSNEHISEGEVKLFDTLVECSHGVFMPHKTGFDNQQLFEMRVLLGLRRTIFYFNQDNNSFSVVETLEEMPTVRRLLCDSTKR